MLSIYIIGSIARREGDIISDKDLLAVGNQRDVAAAVSRYVKDGWNVSQFSRVEFEAMANSKSLFVQHVKQDGRAIRDDSGYLKSVMDAYQIKENYHSELRAAVSPINTFSKMEDNYWGLLFQADVMYVLVRNACVLQCATDATPVFDFVKLIHWVASLSGLTSQEKNIIMQLRPLKYAYRNRLAGVDVSNIENIIEAVQKLKSYWDKITYPAPTEFEFSNGYFDVRVLERQLVSAVGPTYMDELDSEHALSDLWSIICNPSLYDKPRRNCLPRWSMLVSEFLAERHYH